MKRKMTLTPSEEPAASDSPPCKKQKIFTHTPQELVKICSAYMQAQAALLDGPVLPEKVMESVLLRFEQARATKLPADCATPRTAWPAPLMGLQIDPPTDSALATGRRPM